MSTGLLTLDESHLLAFKSASGLSLLCTVYRRCLLAYLTSGQFEKHWSCEHNVCSSVAYIMLLFLLLRLIYLSGHSLFQAFIICKCSMKDMKLIRLVKALAFKRACMFHAQFISAIITNSVFSESILQLCKKGKGEICS